MAIIQDTKLALGLSCARLTSCSNPEVRSQQEYRQYYICEPQPNSQHANEQPPKLWNHDDDNCYGSFHDTSLTSTLDHDKINRPKKLSEREQRDPAVGTDAERPAGSGRQGAGARRAGEEEGTARRSSGDGKWRRAAISN